MRKLKQFLWFLFILILAGGACFYIGYSPLKIPHDSVGVIVSKTSGINETPVESGKFTWNWEFLIPRNAQLRVFSNRPYKYNKYEKITLPSGEVYSKTLKENPDFSFSYNIDIEIRFKSTEFVRLVKESGIASETDVNEIKKKICDQITADCNSLLVEEYSGESLSRVYLPVEDKIKLKSKYSDVEIVSLNISGLTVPDVELYLKTKKMYLEYLDTVQKELMSLAEKQAQEIADYSNKLNKLEQFGKVLKEHPELTEFLKSSKDLNETLKTINTFR